WVLGKTGIRNRCRGIDEDPRRNPGLTWGREYKDQLRQATSLDTMAEVEIHGGTFAGVAAAVRLARVGHTVRLVEESSNWADILRGQLGDTLDFPAPWRDLLKKSGRPAAGALGARGLMLVPDPEGPPTDRGQLWYADRDRLGETAATTWRDFVDTTDDLWQRLRPLGLEAELSPSRVRAARLDPRRSLTDMARLLDNPELAARVTGIATTAGVDPDATPGWLVSRLSVTRTFGRWRLVDHAGQPRPASDLVDVLLDRLDQRQVTVTDSPGISDGIIDTRDPQLGWRRPRRFRPHDSFVEQLLARPPIRTPDPTRFHASVASPGGDEPWAQLLSGALATYAAHATFTGEDIRPSNRSPGR
ncbi:MAG: hypothetical protein ACK5LN_08095, partial [Propioniciclava sp.]